MWQSAIENNNSLSFKQSSFLVWWVDPGWTAGANQSHCITPLSAGWKKGNITKGSWGEVRGRDHSQLLS